MTIFYKLVTDYVLEKLKDMNKNSLQRDNSVANKTLSVVNNFFSHKAVICRDPELAKEKRSCLEVAQKNIEKLSLQKTDKEYYIKLSKEISQCKFAAQQASKDKGYDEGQLGQEMTNIQVALTDLYTIMLESGLLDCAYDNKPINWFHYYAACYITEKVLSGVSHNELVQTKQQMLLTALKNCSLECEGDKPQTQIVLKHISNLKLQNERLCANKRVGNGYLEECLQNAEKMIKEPNEVFYPSIPVVLP